MEPCTFHPSSKNKKIHPGKISYTSGNEKKAVPRFLKVTFRTRKMKKLPIFQEMKLFNTKLKNLLFFF